MLVILPLFSYFSSFLALPPEVIPLINSQIVTVQRTDVDVDIEQKRNSDVNQGP